MFFVDYIWLLISSGATHCRPVLCGLGTGCPN